MIIAPTARELAEQEVALCRREAGRPRGRGRSQARRTHRPPKGRGLRIVLGRPRPFDDWDLRRGGGRGRARARARAIDSHESRKSRLGLGALCRPRGGRKPRRGLISWVGWGGVGWAGPSPPLAVCLNCLKCNDPDTTRIVRLETRVEGQICRIHCSKTVASASRTCPDFVDVSNDQQQPAFGLRPRKHPPSITRSADGRARCGGRTDEKHLRRRSLRREMGS